MSKESNRAEEFKAALDVPELDLKKIRKLCHNGIPELPGMRSKYWKILLNYLPLETAKWQSTLDKQRGLYVEFMRELITDTHANEAESTQDPLGAMINDPLGALSMNDDDDGDVASPTPQSPDKWATYFKDNDVIEQIDKDVKRLCPEFAFFQGETFLPRPEGVPALHQRVCQFSLESESMKVSKSGHTKLVKSESQSNIKINADPKIEHHWEVIERILFVYAKLNPGIGYVQGMNEICGPLYYVMASNPEKDWSEHAEADTYWCFMSLMVEFRDNFVKSLDNSDMGINAVLRQFERTMKEYDEAVYNSLEEKQIKPMFYSFRWLTCLLSQEFPLPDVIRLWDSLFSMRDRQEYLINMCCGLVCSVKNEIISGGFADTVKLLQHLPPLDSNDILAKADGISKMNATERKHSDFQPPKQ
eukprot:m.153757 g.153757  ORF g.153757 m.153757 type:complete len:418 (+) comp30846_c3_seq1:220-1473(+)